ncbi:hypothetical protein [Caulobacter zeae]|uniref:hypothetical protein n=1 Tax=Caulobacter zeae TaxID=2055137 RepID=UPI00196B0AB1|nr:hypothetical protein [Caulobacter zeae]
MSEHTDELAEASEFPRELWQAALALALAESGVRNSRLEELHAGVSPASAVGDYSDVKVVTPYGDIPWAEVSRLCDEEMKSLMIEVVDRIYTVLAHPEPFLKLGGARAWYRPAFDPGMMVAVERHRARERGMSDSEIWRTWPQEDNRRRGPLRLEHQTPTPASANIEGEAAETPGGWSFETTPDSMRALAEAPIADAAWTAKAREALSAGAQGWERAQLQAPDEMDTPARWQTD